MQHKVSYVFTDKYNTIRMVINRLAKLGYDYSYKEFKMADGTTHRFCVYDDDEWTELRDMDAVLAWLCLDIYRLKDAYEDGILCKEATEC